MKPCTYANCPFHDNQTGCKKQHDGRGSDEARANLTSTGSARVNLTSSDRVSRQTEPQRASSAYILDSSSLNAPHAERFDNVQG